MSEICWIVLYRQAMSRVLIKLLQMNGEANTVASAECGIFTCKIT